MSVAATDLGTQTIAQLSDAVEDAAKSALSDAERADAVVVQSGVVARGELMITLRHDASTAEQEAARAAAADAACGANATRGVISLLQGGVCTVTIQGAARRQLGGATETPSDPLRARGDTRRQLSTMPLRLIVTLTLDLDRVDGGKRAASAAADVLTSVGAAAAAAAQQGGLDAEVASVSVTQLDVSTNVAAVGTDSNDAAARSAAIKSEVASATSLASASLTVSALSVAHPPSPPPNPPPAPADPPAPPSPPPAPPVLPPLPFDSHPVSNAGECDPLTCPNGCRSFLWSSPLAWYGQNEQIGGVWPTFRGNVTIKPCTTVVLDLDLNVQLFSLVIMQQATLVVQNRKAADVKLRATCIWVMSGGRLLAGRPAVPTSFTPEQPAGSSSTRTAAHSELSETSELDEYLGAGPFEGSLEVLLSGDDVTTGHCGQGGRILRVDGELSLHGSRPTNTWSWLRTTVDVGASRLVVQGKQDWGEGDEVLVATTSDSEAQTEERTVQTAAWVPAAGGGLDTMLTLITPLAHTHLAVTEAHNGHALSMRAEVAVLSRPTIVIRGVDALYDGFMFKTMEAQNQGMFVKVGDEAIVDLSGVKLRDGGCYPPSTICATWAPKKAYPMFISGGKDALVSMQGCVLQPNFGHGVQAASGHFYDNVVYKPATGFRLMAEQGGAPLVARYNAVFSVRERPTLGYDEFDSFFLLRGTPTVEGNAGAGSENMGFNMAQWDNEKFTNNSAHAVQGVGIGWVGGPVQPLQDLTLWKVNIAIWGYVKVSTPTIRNVRLADFTKGVVWGFVGADSEKHEVRLQTLTIADSLFVGRAASQNHCTLGTQVGIMLAIAGTQGFSISPETCGPLGGHWTRGIYGPESPTGSAPAIAAETRVTGVTFHNFDADSGCGKSRVMQPLMKGDGVNDPAGQESSDDVPPIFFSDISIDDASRTNLAYLPPPHRSWIVPTRCVAMDCDGPKHALIHDLDGTLTGLGADASILARAEFMHQTRADSSEFTWYNIPTKMLYDPAPLNDPGDAGWDMSPYLNYSGGAQSYTYRRRRALGVGDDAGEGRAGKGQGGGRGSRRAQSLASGMPVPNLNGEPPRFSVEQVLDHRRRASLQSSATARDWRQRMVFYTGDERNFYQGLDGTTCSPDEAAFDPSCRTPRKTHKEVAYAGTGGYPDGYGTYREGCTFVAAWNAWSCSKASLTPARLVIESMDADHKSRSLVPVALATGGYVDLMNAGWDHQRALDCGGYNCLQRLMTFHTTVALRRGYDLAFTSTNPQHLRLMMPSGDGRPAHDTNLTKILIACFYSNPQMLEVQYRGAKVAPLPDNSYNFTAVKPTVDDPCGTNFFAAWESKLYVVVCGGVAHAVTVKTIDAIKLSFGLEVSVDVRGSRVRLQQCLP